MYMVHGADLACGALLTNITYWPWPHMLHVVARLDPALHVLQTAWRASMGCVLLAMHGLDPALHLAQVAWGEVCMWCPRLTLCAAYTIGSSLHAAGSTRPVMTPRALWSMCGARSSPHATCSMWGWHVVLVQIPMGWMMWLNAQWAPGPVCAAHSA